MYSGSRPAACSRTVAASTSRPQRAWSVGDDVAGEPPAAGRVLANGHYGLRHPRARGQHGLHFARLDPEPADLDLIIGPPGEHQHPVRRSTSPGPRSGTSAPRRSRTGTPQTARRSGPPGAGNRAPAATPATYSSPATPAGTGSSHPSSTNSRVLATGRPIGTTSPSGRSGTRAPIWCRLTSSEHSVGTVRVQQRHRRILPAHARQQPGLQRLPARQQPAQRQRRPPVP